MNNRIKLKKLKKDNKLMKDIINNTDEMKRLYAAYNEPLKNVVNTTINYKELKCTRCISLNSQKPVDPMIVDINKGMIAQDMSKQLSDVIQFNTVLNGDYVMLEGSLLIGFKKGADNYEV